MTLYTLSRSRTCMSRGISKQSEGKGSSSSSTSGSGQNFSSNTVSTAVSVETSSFVSRAMSNLGHSYSEQHLTKDPRSRGDFEVRHSGIEDCSISEEDGSDLPEVPHFIGKDISVCREASDMISGDRDKRQQARKGSGNNAMLAENEKKFYSRLQSLDKSSPTNGLARFFLDVEGIVSVPVIHRGSSSSDSGVSMHSSGLKRFVRVEVGWL